MPFLLFRQDCHSVNLPILCPDTHVSMKKKSKIFAMKKVGGRGVATTPPPRPEREGVAAKKKKFRNFDFLIFSFCHDNNYAPEILET